MTLRDGHEIQQIIYDGGRAATVQIFENSQRRNDYGDPVWLSVPLAQMPKQWLREASSAIDDALRAAA